MTSRTINDRKTAGASTIWAALGQIMSALNDRDLLPALQVLERPSQEGDAAPEPDRQSGPRCTRCTTRGE
jgi:hypothetical protein